jgi:hypothetical protein
MGLYGSQWCKTPNFDRLDGKAWCLKTLTGEASELYLFAAR